MNFNYGLISGGCDPWLLPQSEKDRMKDRGKKKEDEITVMGNGKKPEPVKAEPPRPPADKDNNPLPHVPRHEPEKPTEIPSLEHSWEKDLVDFLKGFKPIGGM